MRSRPSEWASTLAISVFPTPASPSRNRGLPILSARNTTVASPRSAIYLPRANSSTVSSMERGKFPVMTCLYGQCYSEWQELRRGLLPLREQGRLERIPNYCLRASNRDYDVTARTQSSRFLADLTKQDKIHAICT